MNIPNRIATQHGLSMIELMISMTIGLIIMSGLVAMFTNSSTAQRELQRSSLRIENGRFAIDALTQDLHHAGYYGQFSPKTTPTTAQDPCAITDLTAITAAAGFPIQAYAAPSKTARADVSGTTCTTIQSGLLSDANLLPGSDVLVVRRTSTAVLPVGGIAVNGEVYLQANAFKSEFQLGTGGAITATSTVDSGTVAVIQNAGTTGAAEIRKFQVNIYFVAPCSRPNGGGAVCTGTADDGGDPIPTLKRLELASVGGTRKFVVVPISEGIEYFQMSYGLDTTPSTVNTSTGYKGDGVPDVTKQAPTVAEQSTIVNGQVSLLARNIEKTVGYSDAKTYRVGAYSIGPLNDSYKRIVFESLVRITNLSSRREIPS